MYVMTTVMPSTMGSPAQSVDQWGRISAMRMQLVQRAPAYNVIHAVRSPQKPVGRQPVHTTVRSLLFNMSVDKCTAKLLTRAATSSSVHYYQSTCLLCNACDTCLSLCQKF